MGSSPRTAPRSQNAAGRAAAGARGLTATALLLSALVSGCAGKRNAAFNPYEVAIHEERPYRLVVEPLDPAPGIGGMLPLRYVLANVSGRTLVGCRGSGGRTSFFGNGRFASHVVVVDDPACIEDTEFVLRPRSTISWSDRVEVPNVGTGRAQLDASVVILHPYWDEVREGRSQWEVQAPPVWLTLRLLERAALDR
jgi:hypothetical protein